MLNKIELKAFRSKKSGDYFQFEKYFDDGFGAYHDNIDDSDIKYGNLPSLFMLDTTKHTFYEFKDHNPDEIEEVKFTISIGE